ncbi:hypothetical protein C8R45DRAFT_1114721 [Mycena sanguinolenta]|nr:hypothetical protein C8R45DRAFT_1114721 [Mycena sanguinolenta]
MTHFTSPAPGIGNSVPEAVAIDPTVAALHAVREAMQQLETAASRTSGQQVAPSTAINQSTVSPPLNYLNARVPTTAPSPGPPTFGQIYHVVPPIALSLVDLGEVEAGPWYAITRGLHVGVTLSHALALAAISGVSRGAMSKHKLQGQAVASFNEALSFSLVAVVPG